MGDAIKTEQISSRRQASKASVVVAVATFKRPDALASCLAGLAKLAISDEDWQRDVIVVDNDPAGSAEHAARAAAESFGLQVTYEIEPTPGISAARNRCVALAEGFDYLAFIDDDEWPEPQWLNELLLVARRMDANLVGGPVQSVFDRDPAQWLLDSGIFSRPNFETGRAVRPLASGNLLLRLDLTSSLGRLFNPDYGLTGGSDRELSIRAANAGLCLAWAADARVFERVDPERVNLRWIVQREFRLGNAGTRIDLELGSAPQRWRLALRGVVMTTRALASVLRRAPSRDLGQAARSARRFARGLGITAAACGFTYSEYRRRPRVQRPGRKRSGGS